MAGVHLGGNAHDSGSRLAIGDEVCWPVVLIDGEAEGWPSKILVDTNHNPHPSAPRICTDRSRARRMSRRFGEVSPRSAQNSGSAPPSRSIRGLLVSLEVHESELQDLAAS